MDEDQFAALRRWGEGLRGDGRDEVRAAGKAIVLLCDEVERLEIALVNERTLARRADRSAADADTLDGTTTSPEPASTLHARLTQLGASVLRR